jgi:Flp pilus assembly protein TadD
MRSFFPHPQEPIRVTAGHFARTGICFIASLTTWMGISAPVHLESQEPSSAVPIQATVQGYVHDFSGKPVANATVFLELSTGKEAPATPAETTQTNSEGLYRFAALREGIYSLRAEKSGYAEAIVSTISLAPNETKKIDLVLSKKPVVQAPEFSDEPQFTVAGVTQGTNSGGHGSDTVLRTTEALAKATVSLSKDSAGNSSSATSSATEISLRDAAKRDPDNFEVNRQLGKFLADNGKATEAVPYLEHASQLNPADPEVHHLLAFAEEQSGHSLEAVREYQRAAELDPSERNLFDWGTELLTHRALEPATEVFVRGNRLFPKSVRMLVALGVSWYARGAYDQAAQSLARASDLAPNDPTPYLFLGKMQSVTPTLSEQSIARLARFAQLQPDNPLANYYYAVGLWTQSATDDDGSYNIQVNDDRSARVESLLQKAVHLDANLGAAYLQLGILYSQRRDFSRAITEYQKVIAVSSAHDETLAEAHYRLAQAYARIGNQAKAEVELQLHADLEKKINESVDRQRREIQEFVVDIQNTNSVPQPQP